MKVRFLIYVLISLLFGVSFFILTKDIIFSLLSLCLFVAFFFAIYDKKRNYYKRNLSRSYEAINYINNFIISLSVNPSLTYAFENAKNSTQKGLRQQIESIKHLPIEEEISYLYKYFELPLYGVFINIINQYIFNGGDILDISQALMRDSRALEDRLLDFEKMSRRKFAEFITSWALSFLILFILQFSISSIYQAIDSIAYYSILIFIFYLIFLVSLIFMTYRIYDISFMTKGDSNVKETKTKNVKVKSKSKKRIFKIFNR